MQKPIELFPTKTKIEIIKKKKQLGLIISEIIGFENVQEKLIIFLKVNFNDCRNIS